MKEFVCRVLLTYNFDYINQELSDGDDMYGLVELVKDGGASGYELVRTIGIIVLFLSLLVAAIIYTTSRNRKVAQENMGKIVRVVLGLCILFAFLGFITIVASIGGQINELDVIEPYTSMSTSEATLESGKKAITTISPEYYKELYAK